MWSNLATLTRPSWKTTGRKKKESLQYVNLSLNLFEQELRVTKVVEDNMEFTIELNSILPCALRGDQETEPWPPDLSKRTNEKDTSTPTHEDEKFSHFSSFKSSMLHVVRQAGPGWYPQQRGEHDHYMIAKAKFLQVLQKKEEKHQASKENRKGKSERRDPLDKMMLRDLRSFVRTLYFTMFHKFLRQEKRYCLLVLFLYM